MLGFWELKYFIFICVYRVFLVNAHGYVFSKFYFNFIGFMVLFLNVKMEIVYLIRFFAFFPHSKQTIALLKIISKSSE